jgi:cyclase
MLKKRLVGVITVKNGWAVQSFGYERYLPIGRPEILAENLDRWGADEIIVLALDRSRRRLGPDLDLLGKLGRIALSTPLTYGGGIRNAADASAAIHCGAERVCVDAILHGELEYVSEISAHIGSQALVAALPLHLDAGSLQWFDYQSRQSRAPDIRMTSLFEQRLVSEALVIDWKHEGQRNGFDMELIDNFAVPDVPLIVFGGLSEPAQLQNVLDHPRVAAAGVGNLLNYTEHAIQQLKQELAGKATLRPPSYQTSTTSF